MSKKAWMEYAQELKSGLQINELTICVVSNNDIETLGTEILSRYDFISHGISYLDFDLEKVVATVDEILNVEQVIPSGGKSLVAVLPEESSTSVTFTIGGERQRGTLQNISAAGMTFRLQQEIFLPRHTTMENIVVRNGKLRVSLDGRVVGTHGQDEGLFLVLFSDSCKEEQTDEIHDMIHCCLQIALQAEIDDLSEKPRVSSKSDRYNLYRRRPSGDQT